jgi:hypothetical protein
MREYLKKYTDIFNYKQFFYQSLILSNRHTSEGLIKTLLILSVFSSLSILELLIRSFNIYHTNMPFHSNISIWLLLFIFLSSISSNRIWQFNKYTCLLFLCTVIIFIQETSGYILLARRYGLYYIEVLFWLSLLYFLTERVLLNKKELLVLHLYYLYKYYIVFSLLISFFFNCAVVFKNSLNIDYEFLLGENHISYLAISALFLLLYYPFTLFKKQWKNTIALILLVITPISVGNLGGVITMSIILLLYLKPWKALLIFFTGFIYLYTNLSSNEIHQSYLMITYGMTFEPPLDPYYILNLNNQFTSTYIRNKTNMIALQEFINNPLFGTGLFQIKETLRYAGFYTHSWLFFVLSSYGIFSYIIILITFYCSSGFSNNFKKNGYGSLTIFFFLNSLFIPIVYPFFIVLLILYRFINIVNYESTSRANVHYKLI